MSYADQRYYATGAGRFMTGDPYKASAGADEPGSWNRYSYVEGDPINFTDPEGLQRACPETFCVDVEETLPSPGPTPGPPPTSAPPPGSLSSSVWNVGSLKKAWYKVDQSTDGPASLSRRLRMISELPKAKDQLRSFNPTDADCLKDLKALGVSSADVRKIAGDYNRGGAQLVDIRATPAAIRAQLRPGAAFTATETGRILIYNAENFWQPDYDHVLGTLLHEFIHFAKNLEDADIQKRLGLTVDGVNTSNISKKLTQDCFK